MDISRDGSAQAATSRVDVQQGRGVTSAISERRAQVIAILMTLMVFTGVGYGLNALFTSLGQ